MGKAGWKMLCALFALCAAIASAQTFRTIGKANNPYGIPGGPLIQGANGNFYGASDAAPSGVGLGQVFELTPGGKLTELWAFFCLPNDCSDGESFPTIMQGADGNLYGTTGSGGANFVGTVFQLTPSGVLTTLHDFCSQANCADGSFPSAPLIQGSDGNFYGTTSDYPVASCNGPCGTVFKVTPSGTLTTLFTFDEQVVPALSFQGIDGNLYGTTRFGGADTSGSIFKLTPSGVLTTLYSFCSKTDCADGVGPTGLVQVADGNFFGTTVAGGIGTGGTVFRLTPSGTLTTLYRFCSHIVLGGCADGQNPSPLIQAIDGNFYGTTYGGGANEESQHGTIFKITPDGALTTLYNFCSRTDCTDGINPNGLVQATDGTFYGGTYFGDALANAPGTFFSFCVNLGWFNEELPNYGKPGDTIKILGTDLTGATHVRFAGNAAQFTVVSPTEIDAIVPPFLTTGYVKVTLPSGTMHSNTKFRVLPQITSFAPDSGSEGTLVVLTGVSLTQTTSVTIGGVSASFAVVNDTTVNATVPTGATTGEISITTQGGTVATTTNFIVE